MQYIGSLSSILLSWQKSTETGTQKSCSEIDWGNILLFTNLIRLNLAELDSFNFTSINWCVQNVEHMCSVISYRSCYCCHCCWCCCCCYQWSAIAIASLQLLVHVRSNCEHLCICIFAWLISIVYFFLFFCFIHVFMYRENIMSA